MTLELIVFIAAALFGILLYWRESQSNKLYRFFNKLMYSKKLQMKPDNKKGFIYQQPFLLRLVYITFLFLIAIVVTRFIIPIDLATISLFASMIAGTLIGTYLAGLVFKSSQFIDEKTESLDQLTEETIEDGKEFLKDLKSKDSKEELTNKVEETKDLEQPKKSARERLKDKGYLP